MRRILLPFVFTLVFAAGALAQCTTQLAFVALQPTTEITKRTWGVTFTNCPDIKATMFPVGSTGTLDIGGINYDAVITSFTEPNAIVLNPQVNFTLKLPTGANDPITVFYGSNSASFTYPINGQPTTWALTLTEAVNVRADSFHVGRADATGTSSDASLPAIPPAYRLQFTSTYSYRPPFIPSGATTELKNRIQRDFALKIDTTDKSTGYVDDNSITGGLFIPRLNLAGLVKQAKIGAEASYDRPIHNNDHNADVTATAAGYIPAIQALNLMMTQKKLASPLSLALSAGYRSKRMTGSTYRGRVFSGTAFYHLYAMDNYRIDLTATTTYNDLNDLPAGTPKTQHAFTAAVYYAPSPSSPFSAVASFQNGSFGAVLTKLKQYFIGVSVQKIDQYFNGGATQ